MAVGDESCKGRTNKVISADIMRVSYCKSVNNCSPNLLLLQDFLIYIKTTTVVKIKSRQFMVWPICQVKIAKNVLNDKILYDYELTVNSSIY